MVKMPWISIGIIVMCPDTWEVQCIAYFHRAVNKDRQRPPGI